MTAPRHTEPLEARPKRSRAKRVARDRAPAIAVAADPIAEVAIAAAAFAADDFAAALGALVLSWRAVPDPALADAIALVGKRAGRDAVRPDTDEAWLAAAATDDPVAREGLLQTACDGDSFLRLCALAVFPDPRSATVLVAHLCAPGVGDYRAFATRQRPLFAAVIALADPRALDHLDRMREHWEAITRRSRGRAARPKLDACLAEIRAALAPRAGATLPEAAAAAVRTIAQAARLADTSAADEVALRAAVYADPAFDGPRAVYADWLQQRGDPRGEFIALQLAGGDDNLKRAATLRWPRERDWLGSLAPLVFQVGWSRGFPVEAFLDSHADGTLPADPAWATFERIHRGLPLGDAIAMPCLREVRELSIATLVRLAALVPLPHLVVLGAGAYGCSPEQLETLRATLRALRLPDLRRLILAFTTRENAPALPPDIVPALVAIGPIVELDLFTELGDLAGWLVAVEPTSVQTLELRGHGPTLCCTRDAHGRLSIVTAATYARIDSTLFLTVLVQALEQLPPASLSSVTIPVRRTAWTAKLRTRLARALERHPGVTAAFPEEYAR